MKKLVLLSAILMSTSAMAQEINGVELKNGQTIITLTATERVKIKQDLLQASLRIEQEGKDAKKIQNDINEAMQKASAAGKSVASVKISTGQYYVYSYDRDEPPVKPLANGVKPKPGKLWEGSQTIELEGEDQAALLELAGKIQEMGFVMEGLNYTLSPEEAETFKDNLMIKALAKLQRKAGLAQKALNKSGYDLLEVNIDNTPFQPVPVMYQAQRMDGVAASPKMASPVAESGEQAVELSVNARVLLKP